MSERKQISILLITLILGMVYMVINNEAMIKFPFSGKTHLQSLVYYSGEHIKDILIGFILFKMSRQYRTVFWFYVVLQIADLADFVLTGNKVWLNLSGVPISMNTVGITLFCLAILNEFVYE